MTVTLLNRDSFVGEVNYSVLFCVEGDGVRATLAEPLEDMKEYESVWRVVETEGGARIHHELLTVPNMKLPGKVVRSATKRSVKKVFLRLRDRLEG